MNFAFFTLYIILMLRMSHHNQPAMGTLNAVAVPCPSDSCIFVPDAPRQRH